MLNILKEVSKRHKKKINKIEKMKESISADEALDRLKNKTLLNEDRDFFLKCFGSYYKKATKGKAGNCKTLCFETQSGLEQYVMKNGETNNQYNCIWKAN